MFTTEALKDQNCPSLILSIRFCHFRRGPFGRTSQMPECKQSNISGLLCSIPALTSSQQIASSYSLPMVFYLNIVSLLSLQGPIASHTTQTNGFIMKHLIKTFNCMIIDL